MSISKSELLCQYRKILVNNEEKLVPVMKVAPFVFRLLNVMSEEQEAEWNSLPKDVAMRKLVAFVLKKDTLEGYINFSSSLQYINESQANRLFPFISDLREVGLHDPVRTKGTTYYPVLFLHSVGIDTDCAVNPSTLV